MTHFGGSRRWARLVALVTVVALLALAVMPVLAEDVPGEVVADPWEWREMVLLGVVAVAVIGALTLAHKAVSGLEHSYPPGTASSWQIIWDKLNEKAEASPNQYDDLVVAVARPLVEEILRLLKEREEGGGGVPPSEPEPAG